MGRYTHRAKQLVLGYMCKILVCVFFFVCRGVCGTVGTANIDVISNLLPNDFCVCRRGSFLQVSCVCSKIIN